MCGGTAKPPGTHSPNSGLSPRVRGNRALVVAVVPLDGSIPACAGEPAAPPAPSSRVTVYPRVCGGTAPTSLIELTTSGLSPRVRGNPDASLGPLVNGGSIPACAGEPQHRGPQDGHRTVYPRVCGGTGDGVRLATDIYGLSPRVRGNHCSGPTTASVSWSIPACAGEPLCHNDPVSHEYVKDQWTLRRSTGHAANQSPHKLRVRQRSMARSFDNDGLDLARSGEGGVKPSPLLISAHCALPRATNWG